MHLWRLGGSSAHLVDLVRVKMFAVVICGQWPLLFSEYIVLSLPLMSFDLHVIPSLLMRAGQRILVYHQFLQGAIMKASPILLPSSFGVTFPDLLRSG